MRARIVLLLGSLTPTFINIILVGLLPRPLPVLCTEYLCTPYTP